MPSDGTQQVGYFWSEALGWPLVWDQDEETAIRSPARRDRRSPGAARRSSPSTARTGGTSTSASDGDLDAEVERLVSLGATPVDVGQGDVAWVVLADPDGNEFCVHPPRPVSF